MQYAADQIQQFINTNNKAKKQHVAILWL